MQLQFGIPYSVEVKIMWCNNRK